MYVKGYKRLFWGMIFISFNINLGFINVMPAFLGYILIYFGLSALSPQHKLYQKGKIPAMLLIALTLEDIWNDPINNILTGEIYNAGIVSPLISCIVLIINIYLIYIICMGICELCKERGLNELIDSTIFSIKFYLIISLLYLAYLPFSINLYSEFKIIFVIFVGVVRIIATISVVVVLKKCKDVLA